MLVLLFLQDATTNECYKYQYRYRYLVHVTAVHHIRACLLQGHKTYPSR